MKNHLFTGLLTALILFSCQSNQPADQENPPADAPAEANKLTEAEKAAGWKLLFDGNSLDMWREYNSDSVPEQGWVAKDGDLVIEKAPDPRPEGFGGDLITKEKFGNFELSIDFKITEHANSGILYLVMEEKDSAIWHNAPEFQIIDEEAWAKSDPDFNMDTHRTGDNYDMEACAGRYMNPVGEWNTARIVHNNGKVEHWLNGQKCLEYEVGSEKWKDQLAKSKFKGYPQYGLTKEGHIGLQDHDHEVRFRNIKIRSL